MTGDHRGRSDSGVTLLEMLVALAILAMVLAVSVPSLRPLHATDDTGRQARELLSTIQAARTAAIGSSRSVAIYLDTDRRVYWSDLTGPRQIAGHVAASPSLPVADDGVRQVRFLPDGSASAGTITIMQGRRRDVISIGWPAGAVSMSRRD